MSQAAHSHEDLCTACNLRLDTLHSRRLGINRIIEGERPIQDAAGYLSAFGHLAKDTAAANAILDLSQLAEVRSVFAL
jgi:hypothetical protein